MKRLAMLCSTVAFGLVACANQPQNTVGPSAREQLTGGVQRIQDAVSRADRPAAETALAALIRDVAAAQARGEVDAGSARTILQAADRVSEDVRTMEGPPEPPPVVVRVPVPRPQPPQEPSAIPGGERSAVAPPADPPGDSPAVQPAQQAPAAGQQPGRDVRPPESGNSGQAGQNGPAPGNSGQNGSAPGNSGQNGSQSGQGQNDQGEDDQGEDD